MDAGATRVGIGAARVAVAVIGAELAASEVRGVKSGKLTPGETANLEKGEQRIENQEKRDMAKHNGHLTKHEQRQLNGLEEKQSKKIYRDKHNNVGKK